jgi:hypothetical protein
VGTFLLFFESYLLIIKVSFVIQASIPVSSPKNVHYADLFVQNLRNNISAIKEKLERLTDAYLAEVLELVEYQERKNILMAEKKTIEERL